MKLFCDLDGVLADFDSHYEDCFGIRPNKSDDNVDWGKVRARPGFYQDMPLMSDARVLWDHIRHFKPTIITGVPFNIEEAPQNKRDWAARNLGPHVPVITCRSACKSDHMQAGDIIIDDWPKYRSRWIARGGIWITHVSAQQTVKELFQITR